MLLVFDLFWLVAEVSVDQNRVEQCFENLVLSYRGSERQPPHVLSLALTFSRVMQDYAQEGRHPASWNTEERLANVVQNFNSQDSVLSRWAIDEDRQKAIPEPFDWDLGTCSTDHIRPLGFPQVERMQLHIRVAQEHAMVAERASERLQAHFQKIARRGWGDSRRVFEEPRGTLDPCYSQIPSISEVQVSTQPAGMGQACVIHMHHGRLQEGGQGVLQGGHRKGWRGGYEVEPMLSCPGLSRGERFSKNVFETFWQARSLKLTANGSFFHGVRVGFCEEVPQNKALPNEKKSKKETWHPAGTTCPKSWRALTVLFRTGMSATYPCGVSWFAQKFRRPTRWIWKPWRRPLQLLSTKRWNPSCRHFDEKLAFWFLSCMMMLLFEKLISFFKAHIVKKSISGGWQGHKKNYPRGG